MKETKATISSTIGNLVVFPLGGFTNRLLSDISQGESHQKKRREKKQRT